MKRATAITLLLALHAGAQQPPSISLIRLIATPESYHRKQVVVSGFMYLQRERNALYVAKADFQHAIFKNAIYLQVPDSLFERIHKLNGCYVDVKGTFDGKNTGHVGAFSGELTVAQVSPVSTATVPNGAKDNNDPTSCK